MNSIRKTELHHAATTLELDPTDEVEVCGNFALSFGNERTANRVATLAAKSANKGAADGVCWSPFVIRDGRYFYATILTK